MTLLAITPARGGSKRIPRKNIKFLGDKPLIGWTIDAAKQASCVSRLIVSTEDDEIAAVARELGAEVPFMRPVELACDEAPGIAPVLHAIRELPQYDWILLLQPTSPLRSADDIDGIWEFCRDNNASSAVSVSEIGKQRSWMYWCDSKNRLKPFTLSGANGTPQEDSSPAYVLNGALYLAKTDWLLKNQGFIGRETLGYVTPPERSVDVDTIQDWRWAEFLVGQTNG